MPYLSLNGVEILVRAGSDRRRVDEFGTRGRRPSGQYGATRRSRKREWSFTTDPQTQEQAEAIRALLRGAGDMWLFDEGSLASIKGTPSEPGSVAYLTNGDGAPTVNGQKFVDPVFVFGGRAFAALDARQNLSSVRNTNGDAASWAIVNGSIFNTSLHWWIIPGAIEITLDDGSVGSGIRSGLLSPAVDTYTVSFWIKATSKTGTAKATFWVEHNQGPLAGPTTTIELTVGSWQKITTTITTVVSSGGLSLNFSKDSSDGELVYILDSIMAELRPYATGIQNTGAAFPSTQTSYKEKIISAGQSKFSVNLWTPGRPNAITHIATMLQIDPASGTANRIQARTVGVGTDDLIFIIRDALDVQHSVTISTVWTGPTKMITLVYALDPGPGRTNMEIFVDGILSGSLALASDEHPDLTQLEDLYLGWDGTDNRWNGFMDQLMILPYAMTQSQLTALAALSSSAKLVDLLDLTATGDFVSDPSVTVQARIDKVRGIEFGRSGVWHSNGNEIDFSLLEV